MAVHVSILLPAFNAVSTLARAIESIRRQTYPDWELVVIDDGSTDGTADLVHAFGRADPRIRGLHRPHEGLVPALAAGLAEAKGEWIARMDADDESLPGRLEAQAAWLAAEPAVGVVSCLVEFGGDPRANAGYALHVAWINSLVSPADIALNRFVESPLAHPSVLFRRDVLERHGGYRAGDFPEDYELWLRWMDAGVRIAKVPKVLLRWNDPPSRLSRTDARYAPEKFFAAKAPWIARELAHRGIIALPGSEPAAAGRPVWIWGAGRPTRKRAVHLTAAGVRIAGYIDIDPKKTGVSVQGVPVIAPEALPAPGSVFVLGYVSSRGARDLIRAQLTARGHREGDDFLMCA